MLDRILAAEGESRQSLGRERYLERMRAFMAETRPFMTGQLERVGASLDWSRERFTMDDGSALAVRTAFKRLFDDGLAYRTEALVSWCPTCRTSISDLETIATPETGTLWTIRYHLVDEAGRPDPAAWISVATTRPETILGDTAVAVHPEDERYRHLIGRTVRIPFVDRDVRIIADDVVERAFGTGAVKITPAHDLDDFETGRRHGLASITVLDDEARINEAGGRYAGLDRYEARQRIVADLEALGDLEGSRPHEMVVGRCQRSDDVVEPRLKTQWFIRVAPLAAKALASVREGRVRILPARFEKVFFHWLENIRDWNVSRQLWWGHRIPAWYCPDGHVTVSDLPDGPPACQACGRPSAELVQDPDIFDTWFSSGLWPFSTLGWPERTPDLERYYPGTVMETAYEILFFWVARMMMLGEWLLGEPPFGTVWLGGIVRDPYGAKMSKTKGNVEDPLATIDEMGADALRFALVHGLAPGADVRMSRAKLEGARNFGNKLWNAARFVLGARPIEVHETAPLTLPDAADLGPAERWILDRCAATIEAASRAHDAYQMGEVTRLLHEAIWSEYCDWYLELAKASLSDPAATPAARAATWRTLAWVLERYVRLLHPIMPFITEAIWARLPHEPGDPDLLIVADWPARGARARAQRRRHRRRGRGAPGPRARDPQRQGRGRHRGRHRARGGPRPARPSGSWRLRLARGAHRAAGAPAADPRPRRVRRPAPVWAERPGGHRRRRVRRGCRAARATSDGSGHAWSESWPTSSGCSPRPMPGSPTGPSRRAPRPRSSMGHAVVAKSSPNRPPPWAAASPICPTTTLRARTRRTFSALACRGRTLVG